MYGSEFGICFLSLQLKFIATFAKDSRGKKLKFQNPFSYLIYNQYVNFIFNRTFLNHFNSLNSSLHYFPQIDALRFIAVSMVCLSHWLSPNHWVNHLQLGRFGVELFFVISGFLITRILLQLNDGNRFNINKIKTFVIRRILRIFPAYYFVILITYLSHDGHFNTAIFWNISYLSNFYMLKIGEFPGVMSHFWSLSVEEHFYLIWPFLILTFNRKSTLYIILSAIIVGLTSRLFFYCFEYHSIYPKVFTFSCFDAFAIGGLMAFLYLYNRNIFVRLSSSKLIFLFVFFVLALTLYNDYINPNSNIWDFVAFRFSASLFSFYLISFAIYSNLKFLNSKKIVFLGKLSYSMYLFHNFIPGFMLGMKSPSNISLRLIIYFIVLIAVSYLTWKLIEMPFNHLKRNFRYDFYQ